MSGGNSLTSNSSKAQKVSWSEIETIIKNLSKQVSELPHNFSSISTISRGGLIPARLLADHLGINIILVDQKTIPMNSIFVDDIYDTGNTFKKILNKTELPSKLVFVTLFARRGKKYPKQLIYGKKTISSAYLVFPWDKLEYKYFKKRDE